MKIAIIGGGWVGCVTAWKLRKPDYDVTLYEKNDDIFKGESGKFGLRLHIGPHYPDSENTRKSCQLGLQDYIQTFPDLFTHHAHSIYALGTEDANGRRPEVDAKTFEAICREMGFKGEIDPKEWGYKNLVNAFDVDEPSAAVGERLRESMRKRLQEVGVKIVCNYKVEDIQAITLDGKKQYQINKEKVYDQVVNATYYQDLVPKDSLPEGIEAVYQPCLTLRYRDTQAEKDPFSFTVMAGMFPCLMPREDHVTQEGEKVYREYTLYHAKYTILDSCKTAAEAQQILDNLTNNKAKYDAFIAKYRPLFEAEIKKFYPGFEGRFEFVGTNAGIAAKLRTKKNFRSAVTFMKDGIMYVFSGKVNNVLDAANEIARLITTPLDQLCCEEGYYYLPDGEFARSRHEIIEKTDDPFNACNLHTMQELSHLFSAPQPSMECTSTTISAAQEGEGHCSPSQSPNLPRKLSASTPEPAVKQKVFIASPPAIMQRSEQAVPRKKPKVLAGKKHYISAKKAPFPHQDNKFKAKKMAPAAPPYQLRKSGSRPSSS